MNRPIRLEIITPQMLPSKFDHHTQRRLSDMNGQYLDQEAYTRQLAEEDTLLYEVYEVKRPGVAGELRYGVSVVHAGMVGEEYFMTKGHFHAVLERGEVYHCLRGQGFMVMETSEGEWAVEGLRAGGVLYVPPRWAHRAVNSGSEEDFVLFYVYPADAGHDYGTIEARGFRKAIVEINGAPAIIDNPRWTQTENASEAARG